MHNQPKPKTPKLSKADPEEELAREKERQRRQEQQEFVRLDRQTDQKDFLLNRNALLKEYYAKVFPILSVCRWLGYNTQLQMNTPSKPLYRREVSFQVETQTGDECVIRFLTYSTPQSLLNDLTEKVPKRLDFGAIYNVPPSRQNQNAGGLSPVEREYVIDIDMSDYDDIRTCCSGKKVCAKCWKFLNIAQKVLSRSLKSDFGFKHILWVFSGRRGIHAWVCDKRARVMDSSVRQHISQHLDITVSGKRSERLIKPALRQDLKSSVSGDFTSRSMRETYELIDRYFLPVLVSDQSFFSRDDNVRWATCVLWSIAREIGQVETPPFNKQDQQEKMILSEPTSEKRWERMTKIFGENLGSQHHKIWTMFRRELAIGLLYPKLDLHVSAQINHLLKIPFNVHQDTGCISVPVRGSSIEHFDLDSVPLITTVLTKDGDKILLPYLKLMDDFVAKVEADGFDGPAND